jgi:TPR repeat protein
MAYLHGDGTPVNKEEGVKWMKHAARNGVHEAILYMESYQIE